jgi:dephospho-CoA kinase
VDGVTRFVGLTGGIATGKSTVTTMLRALGAHVLDADAIAREVVAPGTDGLREIAERFPGVVVGDVLDRKALAARIFRSEADRAALNAITHPRIQATVLERTAALHAQGVETVVYDAPLLIENGLHQVMDGVILVVTSPAVQLERLMARDALTEAEAAARVRSQMPLEEKRAVARWIIDNSGSLEDTRAQVQKVWLEVTRGV